MSTFTEFYKNYPEWMTLQESDSDVVLTSRVRLARNIENTPFPGWAKKEVQLFVLKQVKEALNLYQPIKEGQSFCFDQLDTIEKQVFVERHLISREHAAKGANAAVFLTPNCDLSLMVNEEDHLRLQSIQPGLNLDKALDNLTATQDHLEEALSIAYHEKLGYLTACPTNLGTGMRASAMVHLPALGILNELNQSLNAMNQLGLAVRGLYGEGTESFADLYQISNQSTLGEGEQTIIENLNRVLKDLIKQERQARLRLLENDPYKLQDKVNRAYHICCSAYLMTSNEALSLLSILKMGVSLGFFNEVETSDIDLLLLNLQPAHLQIALGSKLSVDERDIIRATKVRERIQRIAKPDFSIIKLPSLN